MIECLEEKEGCRILGKIDFALQPQPIPKLPTKANQFILTSVKDNQFILTSSKYIYKIDI